MDSLEQNSEHEIENHIEAIEGHFLVLGLTISYQKKKLGTQVFDPETMTLTLNARLFISLR